MGRDLMVQTILDGSLKATSVVVRDDIVPGSAAADLAFNLLGVAVSHAESTSPFYKEVSDDLVEAVASTIGQEVLAAISFAAVTAEKLRNSSPPPDKTTTFFALIGKHVRARCADTDDPVPDFAHPAQRRTMLRRELAGWCGSKAFSNMLESCALDERFENICALDDVDVKDDEAVRAAITEAAAATSASFLANLKSPPTVPVSLKRKARRPLNELTDVQFEALMKRRLE